MTITDEKIENQCQKLSALLKAKNRDYGDSFAEPPFLAPEMNVIRAAQVLLSDKFKRLRNLWTTTRTPKTEESLEDTLRDIAGYCVLLLAYVDKSQINQATPLQQFNELNDIENKIIDVIKRSKIGANRTELRRFISPLRRIDGAHILEMELRKLVALGIIMQADRNPLSKHGRRYILIKTEDEQTEEE